MRGLFAAGMAVALAFAGTVGQAATVLDGSMFTVAFTDTSGGGEDGELIITADFSSDDDRQSFRFSSGGSLSVEARRVDTATMISEFLFISAAFNTTRPAGLVTVSGLDFEPSGAVITDATSTEPLPQNISVTETGFSFSLDGRMNDVSGFTIGVTAAATTIPLPAAGWLLLAGLGGLVGVRRGRGRR